MNRLEDHGIIKHGRPLESVPIFEWRFAMGKSTNYIQYPDAPWCWNIYLHDWVILVVNVGKYSIHLGKFHHDRSLFSRSLEPWLGFGESSPSGRKIQLSEILFHLPRCLISRGYLPVNTFQ